MFAPTGPASWLVTGSYDLKSAVRRPDQYQVRLWQCPAELLSPATPDAEIYRVMLGHWPAVRTVLLDQDGTVLADSTSSAQDVGFEDPGLAVLGLLRCTGTGLQAYAAVDRYLDQVRLFRLPQPTSAPAAAVPDLFTGIDAHFLRISNHLCFRIKLKRDVELEHKFTLVEHPDGYALARQTLQWAHDGGIPGWTVEFREELQSWDFLNHLYVIEEPTEDAGYVSFIPTTDGRLIVKRKIFDADVAERPELHNRGVAGDTDFETHIREVLHLQPTWHASFRRVRHDVAVESTSTGNVFAMSYDHCTIVDDAGRAIAGLAPLSQCEVEYIYSQSLAPVSFDSVYRDLDQLQAALSGFYAGHGIATVENHESKLTFLRGQLLSASALR